jgi:predicted nucleic acid-binding protein
LKPFADSSIVIYALVPDDVRKQAIAQQILAGVSAPRPVIATQVLAETYHVLTRRKAWKPADALRALRLLAELPVVVPAADGVMQGLELAARHKLSGWDALIVQAALQGGCDTLYSEDLQAGRRFEGLEVVNPFDQQVQEGLPKAGRRRVR